MGKNKVKDLRVEKDSLRFNDDSDTLTITLTNYSNIEVLNRKLEALRECLQSLIEGRERARTVYIV